MCQYYRIGAIELDVMYFVRGVEPQVNGDGDLSDLMLSLIHI